MRLLEADLANGALLLERAEPGTPLLSQWRDDEAAIPIAASVLRRLWRPAPEEHDFPTVADSFRAIDGYRARFGGAGPLPVDLFQAVEETFADLLAAGASPVLLHGDLNYGNVLAAQRASWLAIDPKGVVGEPAFDTAVLLHDPLPDLLQEPDPGAILRRRIRLLASELDLEPERIRTWGFAHSVLSAVWSVEDNEDWRDAVTCAELLRSIRVV